MLFSVGAGSLHYGECTYFIQYIHTVRAVLCVLCSAKQFTVRFSSEVLFRRVQRSPETGTSRVRP